MCPCSQSIGCLFVTLFVTMTAYSATVMISSSGVFILATLGTLVSIILDFAGVLMKMANRHDHDRLFMI